MSLPLLMSLVRRWETSFTGRPVSMAVELDTLVTKPRRYAVASLKCRLLLAKDFFSVCELWPRRGRAPLLSGRFAICSRPELRAVSAGRGGDFQRRAVSVLLRVSKSAARNFHLEISGLRSGSDPTAPPDTPVAGAVSSRL